MYPNDSVTDKEGYNLNTSIFIKHWKWIMIKKNKTISFVLLYYSDKYLPTWLMKIAYNDGRELTTFKVVIFLRLFLRTLGYNIILWKFKDVI